MSYIAGYQVRIPSGVQGENGKQGIGQAENRICNLFSEDTILFPRCVKSASKALTHQ